MQDDQTLGSPQLLGQALLVILQAIEGEIICIMEAIGIPHCLSHTKQNILAVDQKVHVLEAVLGGRGVFIHHSGIGEDILHNLPVNQILGDHQGKHVSLEPITVVGVAVHQRKVLSGGLIVDDIELGSIIRVLENV